MVTTLILIFGLTTVIPGEYASAAQTTKKQYTYTVTVPKSDSAVYNLTHSYDTIWDWAVPVQAVISSSVYFKARSNGYLELVNIKPSNDVILPTYVISTSSKILTNSSTKSVQGYSSHVIGYKLLFPVPIKTTEKYFTMNVTGTKVSADTKNMKITFYFNVQK